MRKRLEATNGSWRVDETYVRVKGQWRYFYRAVDFSGATWDFLLSAKQDAEAAKGLSRNKCIKFLPKRYTGRDG